MGLLFPKYIVFKFDYRDIRHEVAGEGNDNE